jgi:hypothetical protein
VCFCNHLNQSGCTDPQNYSVRRRTRKYAKSAFYFSLDLAATNAYIAYKAHCQRTNSPAMDHTEFRELLAVQLAGPGSNLTSPIRPTHKISVHARQHQPAPDPINADKADDEADSDVSETESVQAVRRKRGRPRTTSLVHSLVREESSRRDCAVCSAKPENAGNRVRKPTWCPGCKKGYCLPCFFEAHEAHLR